MASIAAAAAYASLMVTSFRGFYQFGVMGASGRDLLLARHVFGPSRDADWLDRRGVGGEGGEKSGGGGRWRGRGGVVVRLFWLRGGWVWGRDYAPDGRVAVRPHAPLEFGPLARFLKRHGGAVTAAFTVMSVVSVVGLKHFLKDPFEYDFRKLNAKLATTQDEQQFNKNLNDLFGRWPSPTILLADSVEEVEPMKAAIRRQDRDPPGIDTIGQITTIFDLLPGPPEVQRRKLELLAQIRKLTHDPALVVLNEKEKADLAKIDPSPDLHELTPMDVPQIARRPFTEVDGSVGKVVLVYPHDRNVSVWNGRDLLKIASVLQTIKLDNGKVIETSGFAVVFGAMIRSILHDGPIATVASLIAVLIIIAFTIRPAAAALMALATLALGVLLMMGGAGLAKVHVTFLNFIALPITFGIGAEYALNVVTRYREERDVSRAVVSTGAAVALCSWTTIVGYGSLLAASNQALNGFGLMAIIGEVVCLSAAIVALPAFLFWRHAGPFQEEPRRTNGVGETAETLASDREDPRHRGCSGRTSKRWQALPMRLAICIRFATDQRLPARSAPSSGGPSARPGRSRIRCARSDVARQPAGTARTRSARRRAPRAAPARTGAARSLSSGRWYRRPSAPSPGTDPTGAAHAPARPPSARWRETPPACTRAARYASA